ncbi:MAG: Gfo/Idh/MocA family oxidoreductase [Gemmataceae bacterium]|nr:Gfo/Idh/MocA family oxidoreductase [Gemmataceae bacterium]
MPHRPSRRRFLQASAALTASAALADTLTAAQTRPAPADRIRLGIIGVAGQGNYNLSNVRQEEIVALCDVDEERAAPVRKQFPDARFCQDYRRLLDQKDVQAVVISTPDHMHAPIAVAALRAGKHVYCEKPLAHSVHEVRAIVEAAARHNAVTQMGTQIHAGENYRRVVEIVQAGVLGPVRRVHVWCSRRPDVRQRSPMPLPIPRGLNYYLWLGVAPARPYDPAHLHFHWRWYWDFGGGVLADMACHFMDLPHWALGLRTPTTITANGRVTYQGDNNVPDLLQVDYRYPARGEQPPVHLTWYHGVAGPDLNGNVTHRGFSSGVLFEGERGSLVADYRNHRLLPEERFRDFKRPAQTIPRSIGHHREWLEAIRTRGTTTCNFAYGGALTESVLLGNVAYRSGQRLEWDGQAGRVTNTRAADQYLRREYRKGWSL